MVVSLVYTFRVCPPRNDIAFIQAKNSKDNLALSRKKRLSSLPNQTLPAGTKIIQFDKTCKRRNASTPLASEVCVHVTQLVQWVGIMAL